jgi:hypothetical protein
MAMEITPEPGTTGSSNIQVITALWETFVALLAGELLTKVGYEVSAMWPPISQIKSAAD